MRNYTIVPSILSANSACLGTEIKDVIEAGANWIHIDMFDNHFVSNLAFGPHVCKDFRKYGFKKEMDVHLSVANFHNLIPVLAENGANYITFHPESTPNINASIKLIHDHGLKVGLAFSPSVSLSLLDRLEHNIELLTIMGVCPGFGGQKFLPSSLETIKKAHDWIKANDQSIRLCVDGGINFENIVDIAIAGADTFIIGSSIFNTENYKLTLKKFRKLLEHAHKKGAVAQISFM